MAHQQPLRICVLQPDYSTTSVDYKNYDPPRDLSALLPNAIFEHVFLNKLTVYQQLKKLASKGFDIFVNLCEGYLEWEVPSIDVIYYLELLNLPYTGPAENLYDPPKPLMKYVAYTAGVATPAFIEVPSKLIAFDKPNPIPFPLFVKPAKAGDSIGVDAASLVNNPSELAHKITTTDEVLFPLLVEQYIPGREFTVLVAAYQKSTMAFTPVEYIFPKGYAFKSYQLKTSELHTDANVPCTDRDLANELKVAAIRIFEAFDGLGYARLDFRVNEKNEIYFLEINFTCSVFYTNGYQGSADYILQLDGFGTANFLQIIINEGIERHNAKQKKYFIQGNSIVGYGIFAKKNIAAGEVIFKGEELAQRIVTKKYVDRNWSLSEKRQFAQYAYPISEEVYILWDKNPANWAPQNHSCDANTVYNGLNVVALASIEAGDELTLDYGYFLDNTMEPFACKCKSKNCRGQIKGLANNTITFREQVANKTQMGK